MRLVIWVGLLRAWLVAPKGLSPAASVVPAYLLSPGGTSYYLL